MKSADSPKNETITLYHFTNLLSLPDILKEGITRGDIPLEKMPYKDRPQAPNLTRNPSPKAQDCCSAQLTRHECV